ncbi:MAG: hypothetical protein AAF916_07440 [Planctomycetota bacterium]
MTTPAVERPIPGTAFFVVAATLAVAWTGAAHAFTRPATPPASADDLLVSSFSYDDAGRQFKTTDPSGQVTATYYDDAGRVAFTVENFDNFALSAGLPTNTGDATDTSKDRVTAYTYRPDGQQASITAVDPNGDGSTTDNQDTYYVYEGDLTAASTLGVSPVSNNSLLRATAMPDAGYADRAAAVTAVDGTGLFLPLDVVRLYYRADGSVFGRINQRMILLGFIYDDAGRRTSQTVVPMVSSPWIAVSDQRVEYAYTAIGLLDTVTTYDAQTGGSVTSEVKTEYDGLQRPTAEYQQHGAAVNTGTSPNTAYVYDTTVSSSKLTHGGRLIEVTYPNGRKLHHAYDTGDHSSTTDAISRLSALLPDDGAGSPDTTAGSEIATYLYLGSGRTVNKTFPVPDLALDYTGEDPDTGAFSYRGLDGFGRIAQQRWLDVTTPSTPVAVYDARHGYDRSSNRLYSDRQKYASYSETYAYDGLHRLASYDAGEIKADLSGIEDYWSIRASAWTLDALGNPLSIDEYTYADYYDNAQFNDANEMLSREISANRRTPVSFDSFHYASSLDDWEVPGNDTVSVSGGRLYVDTISADNFDGHTEQTPRAILLLGEEVGPTSLQGAGAWPVSQTTDGRSGFVFGYKSPNDYWIGVLKRDPVNSNHKREIYHVVNGQMTLVKSANQTTIGSYIFGSTASKATFANITYTFPDGYPSGRVGLFTDTPGYGFDYFRAWRRDSPVDLAAAASYRENESPYTFRNNESVKQTVLMLDGVRNGLSGDPWRLTFKMRRSGAARNDDRVRVHFNRQPGFYSSWIDVAHSAVAVTPASNAPSSTVTIGNVATCSSATDDLWARIEADGTGVVTLKTIVDNTGAPSEANWSATGVAFESSTFPMSGGLVGFAARRGFATIHEVVFATDHNDDGTWVTEAHIDRSTLVNGYQTVTYEHDEAGNLTFDGAFAYAYDAWNRVVTVNKAHRPPAGGAVQLGSVVMTAAYDGLGRRIRKSITNYGDADATYHAYYNGQQNIEERNGSDLVLRQRVWAPTGVGYIDELLQVSLNDDPLDITEQDCESAYWAFHNANYNVMGLVDSAGALTERYEYTPYGMRQVYSSAGANDAGGFTAELFSQRWEIASAPGVPQPYGLNDAGHQGLLHDELLGQIGTGGLIYNRARVKAAPQSDFLPRDGGDPKNGATSDCNSQDCCEQTKETS